MRILLDESLPIAIHRPEDPVRRFNEDEAAWRNYGRKRELRHLLRPDSSLPEETLDYLDWLEAERECREIPRLGRLMP
ncbi:MAG: hypothetical protein WBM28_06085 [Burkholderiales bacterium]